MGLFKKAVAFTDIHYGKKTNDEAYCIKCDKFVDWFIEEGKAAGADTCIFLGDWHDSRVSLNIRTLHYSLNAMEKLSNAFENFYVITGNHDIYHRTRREYNSVEYGRNINNMHIINEPTVIDEVALVPWMVGDEHKKVKKLKAKYMFGHFELPNFLMNANVRMGDTGGVKAEDLGKPDYVFSGHFHMRQNQGNVWYIGNAFPQDYTDTDSDERGMMFLEWGGEPTFKSWPDQPVYRTFNLSEILDEPEKFIGKNVNARIQIDVDLSFEEIHYLKESFEDAYGAEDISFIQKHVESEDTEWTGNIEFQTVDQIVLDGIHNLDEETVYDKDLLVKIYNELHE